MATMIAAQISKPGGDFELVERSIPEPGAGEVRIKIEACGICHGDAVVKGGKFPGLKYPRVPGHEVAGTIDKIGPEVTAWKEGERVGAGWHGGHCFECDRCRAGDFMMCSNALVTGLSHDGGYAEYMVSPQEALARIPDELNTVEAAPLLCAGLTTYNALRHAAAEPGSLVAILGLGGLGHMALQFADKFGFRTIAISHSGDKEHLAFQLGADLFIDSSKANPAEELMRLGGASAILATAPNSRMIADLVPGLGVNGRLVIVSAPMEPMNISPVQFLMNRRGVQGWTAGTAKESEDTMRFCVLKDVRAMIETYPLDKVNDAYEQMITNKARFRVVLKIA